MSFGEIRSSDGDMLLVEYGTFQAVLQANVIGCDLGGCRLIRKSSFELTISHARASRGKKTWGNVGEKVGSERPVHPDMGKHKPRELSDALAAHLCSEIAQGPVRDKGGVVVFSSFFRLRGNH